MDVEVARCDANTGTVFHELGEYDRASELYKRAQKAFIKKNLIPEMARCDLKLAGIYRNTGRHNKAMKILISTKKTFEELGMYAEVERIDFNLKHLNNTKVSYLLCPEEYEGFLGEPIGQQITGSRLAA
jgi:tetratricopeptide (TPR) repeat protein